MWPFKICTTNKSSDLANTVFYDAEFALEHLDVFAVERSDSEPDLTIISYFCPSSQGVIEFSVRCSPEMHQKLVDRFRHKMNSPGFSLPRLNTGY